MKVHGTFYVLDLEKSLLKNLLLTGVKLLILLWCFRRNRAMELVNIF
jgi:hypothetical protein